MLSRSEYCRSSFWKSLVSSSVASVRVFYRLLATFFFMMMAAFFLMSHI